MNFLPQLDKCLLALPDEFLPSIHEYSIFLTVYTHDTVILKVGSIFAELPMGI